MGLIGKIFVKLGLDNSEFKKGIDDSEKKSSAFKDTLKGIGQGMLAAFSVGALINFGKKAVQVYNEQAASIAKLESVLRSTGNAAGLTSEQLQSYASSLQKTTKFGDEATLNAMALLATFKSIKGDIFKQTIASAQDLATVIGTDLNGAVMQLGKALEAPEIGLTMLRRSGISFSTEQIEQIKQLVSEGKKHEAQLVMLNEVQSQFGGAAKAAADTAAGAWTKVKNAFGDLMEVIGSGTESTKGFANSLTIWFEQLNRVMTSEKLNWWQKLTSFLGGNRKAMALANEEWAQNVAYQEELERNASARLEGLESIEEAERRIATIGKDNLSETQKLAVVKLNAWIKDKKAAEDRAKLDAEEIAAIQAKEAAEKAAEEGRRKGQEGTIQRQTYLIQQLQERIKLEQDEGKRAAMNQDLQNLQYQLEVMQMTTKELKEQIALRQRAQTALPKVSHNIQGKAVVQNQPDPIKPVPTQAEELSDFNDNFEEEVNRSANIAANFGQSVAQSMSDSMRVLIDAIASGEKIDASAMVKAILMPFADMAVKIGEVLVASGAAAIAAKLLIKNPYTAIAAGAALIAIGTAAQAAIGSISSNIGNTGGGRTTTFTGGAGYSSTPALAAINAPPVEVVGVLRGQDIYLSSEKYKQNKGR